MRCELDYSEGRRAESTLLSRPDLPCDFKGRKRLIIAIHFHVHTNKNNFEKLQQSMKSSRRRIQNYIICENDLPALSSRNFSTHWA